MPGTTPTGIPAAPAPLVFKPLPVFRSGILDRDSELAQCRGKRIGILIITYNALTTITKVLERITPAVWENVEEIAVFDDASQDATYELAVGLKAQRELPKLTVLRHEKNLGYGGNQKAGYRYFIEKGFDIVVLLHGDGQYAPEILSHVYHPIVNGHADAVFGSRMMKDYGGPLQGGMPLYKYVGNRILSVFENWSLGLELTEFHSGYRAYNLHALARIDFSRMTDDFHFDTEIIIKLHHQRFRIHEVPIPTYYGTEICYVNGLRYARDVFRAVRRYKQTVRSVACFPEYREYFVHYPVKTSKYSSHYWARRLTGSNHDVLDLGCGTGAVAEELVKNGNRVTGVDVLPAPAEGAPLEAYYAADLNAGIGDVIRQLRGRTFDRVLLLDVLEHLRDPAILLRDVHEALAPDGLAVVSVPNVANITVRIALLIGRWEYTERGILDRTHVRFFTRRTARRFLEENDFCVVEERSTVMPVELALGLPAENPMMVAVNRLLAAVTALFPSLFGYQVMFVVQSGRGES